jgi:spermidine synthase
MKIFNQKTLCIAGSFLAGFSLMTVELVSARIVAPILGSSVFTWTSVIGITLLGLSIGSFIGGKCADGKDVVRVRATLPLVFFISSVLTFIIPGLTQTTGFILESSDSIIFLNIAIALYLFLLPAVALGAIQPFILKKYAHDFSNIGREYGTLSAVWSIGSILGVFLTGFVFISSIGSKETLWVIATLLFISGILFSFYNKKLLLYFMVFFLVIASVLGLLLYRSPSPAADTTGKAKIVFDTETDYYHVRVADMYLPGFSQSRVLFLDFDSHSVDTPIINENFYPELYPVFSDLKNDVHSILAVGAGAYTMPKYFSLFYPTASVSVMETDPAMVDIGKNYFNLDTSRIKTEVGDARLILPKSKHTYDVVFGDAYNSFISVPWNLLTKEWNDTVKGKLNPGGVYAINFIGATEGSRALFTKSVLKTFTQSFPNYYIFTFGTDTESTQNVVLVGVNGPLPFSEEQLMQKLAAGKNPFLARHLLLKSNIDPSEGTLLTDNFAPVEKLMSSVVEDYFPKNLSFMRRIF